MIQKSIYIALLLSIWALLGESRLLITVGNSTEVQDISYSYYVGWGAREEQFPGSGEVVLADPEEACSDVKNLEALKDKIVLVASDNCYPQRKAHNVWKGEPRGILIESYRSGGALFYWSDTKDHRDINVPIAEVSKDAYKMIKELLEEGKVVSVTYTSDPNPWDDINSQAQLWAFTVLYIPTSLTTMAIAAHKLVLFTRASGPHITVTHIVLTLEIIASFFRFMFALDPGSDRGVLPYAFTRAIITFSFPFTLAGTLLISFYWHQVARASKMAVISRNFDRLRWPVYVVIVLLPVIEIISVGLRASWSGGQNEAIVLTGAIYLIVSLLTGIFFLWTGYKFVRFLQKHKSTRISRITRFIFSSAVGLLIFFFVCIIVSSTGLFYHPGWYTFLNWGSYGAMTIVTFSHTLVFKKPGDDNSSSSPDTSATTKQPNQTLTSTSRSAEEGRSSGEA